MAKYEKNLCCFYLNLILLFLEFYDFSVGDPIPYNSVTISSFSYPETKLRPFEWRYIRVDLPPWFSSMSIAIESDANLKPGKMEKISKGMLPLICFRDGSLPLPDFSNNALNHLDLTPLSNGSVRAIEGIESSECCYPLQKQVVLELTNEQTGNTLNFDHKVFCADNTRCLVCWNFQWNRSYEDTVKDGKLDAAISRGSSYSFTANVSVEGCVESSLWGPFCNQSINALSCSNSDADYSVQNNASGAFYNDTAVDVISCRNSVEDSCLRDSEATVYSLEVTGMAEQLAVSATNISLKTALSSNSKDKVGQVVLKCYARYGAIPLAAMHDYSVDLIKGPLVVPFPKIGRWYITILPSNIGEESNGSQNSVPEICYSLDWQVTECPLGKGGFNCSSRLFTLQTILRKNPSIPFESYYTPLDGLVSSDAANFPLGPLLSNSSLEGMFGTPWMYFVLDIPRGAAGGNLHLKLTSKGKAGYEMYMRYGGLASASMWDYYYIDPKNSSDGSMFFTLYNSSNDVVDFYILYAREGTWSFGLRHLNDTDNASFEETRLSVSLERCPKRCSAPHGSCQNFVDESGLTIYSYCSCDRTHGGIDCSIKLVSEKGHKWQSVSLVASNAAAILPAYWALRKKAYAESVIFTSSGISSALYHACDVGVWCVMTFRVLQFMDFWLSFMAVVSTFVYMTDIDEASKRTIHATVSILTALMAISGATRSANMGLVIAIGASGLLIGWIIEFSTKFRSLSSSTGLCLSTLFSWNALRTSLRNGIKLLIRRFRWGFMLVGSIAFIMAGVSWKLETNDSYWIWHSIWHVSMYTSSFFFLCSKVPPELNTDSQIPQTVNYELTRQDSISHGVE